ncbi:MAG: PAS domain-containing sensor histidine kinase, partial [Cyanobacteria bacterium]|nr:PAS domain-containing sensor histidine kinase [Cyanobacteriota bacterium]
GRSDVVDGRVSATDLRAVSSLDAEGRSKSSKQHREALSRWYLARLRRRAHGAQGSNLTPAALIAADREGIEKLVLTDAAGDGRRTPTSIMQPPTRQSALRTIAISVGVGLGLQFIILAGACFLAFQAAGGNADLGSKTLAVLSLVSVAWAGSLLFLFIKFRKRIKEALLELTRTEGLEGIDELDCFRFLFQKREMELEELQEKEKAIVDFAEDIVCSIDTNLRFASVNPTPARLLGYPVEELLGQPILKFIDAEDIAKTENAFKNARSMKTEIGFEIRLKSKSGSSIDFFVQADWSQTANVYFCVAHDITLRKNADRSKQEFVAMLSHDLRSPLTSIQGTLSLLKAGAMGPLSEQAITRVSRSERVSQQLIRLINDLLDIEKVEAGMFELNIEPCELADIIEQSVEAVQVQAEQKKVKINKPDTKFELKADKDRLFRVLTNLLSNAVKFSNENTEVSIEVVQLQGFVEIRVKDQGRGLSMEDHGRIFDRYQQVEAADATLRGGSGLGLAICKAIVERHGGTIAVDSELGVGSVFRFCIPVIK